MNELYDKTLQRLIKYRRFQNMTQMDMENQFGVTQSHYSKMELGRSEISYDFLSKLYANRWDIDYLVTGIAYHKRNRILNKLMQSYRGKNRNEFIKLIVWTIEQLVDLSQNEEMNLEIRTMRMLLEAESVSSIMYLVRNIKNFSQVNMAETLGIGMKKYRRMEKGDTQPDLELLTLVYQISNCRPSLFLGGDEGTIVLLNSLWNRIEEKMQQKIVDFLDLGIEVMALNNRVQ